MCIESVMPTSHLILCHPLLLLPPILPSIRVFSSESTLRMRWPKYWSFSFNISPFNEHSRLVSFRMVWLDFVVQGTLKSLLQHHSSKASILLCSAFFTVQLSHPLSRLVMPSNHLILCRPLLLLPPILPSIRVFSNESTLRMRWPKYWSFSFSISPSDEHRGLMSFRMNWLDLLAVPGTLKSLLQQHSSLCNCNFDYSSYIF